MSINPIDATGRSQIQRDLKHMVRDVRHQVQGETRELRAAGGSAEKIAAVRSADRDFRDGMQAAFKDAGQGGSFDATAVPAKVNLAIVIFTEALRVINTNAAGGAPAAETDGVGSLLNATA